jgi:hypothetical protein
MTLPGARIAAALLALPALALPAAAPAQPAPAAQPAQWQESATRDYYDADLRLRWQHPYGDWDDADGRPQGGRAFATATAQRGDTVQAVRFDVTDMVRRHGADFRITGAGAPARFYSREAIEGPPILLVTRGGQTRQVAASADTFINPATVRPMGGQPHLDSRVGMLLRFPVAADPAIERAELVLMSTRRFGDVTFGVLRPAARILFAEPGASGASAAAPAEAAAASAQAAAQPAQVAARRNTGGGGGGSGRAARAERSARLAGAPPPPPAAPGRVVREWTGADLDRTDHMRVEGDIATAWIEGDRKAFFADVLPLPGRRQEAWLTVVLKLHDDFPAHGGKLPGLSNTGLGQGGTRDSCVVGGQPVGNGGWGGRKANGCRWSARTLYRGRIGNATGAGSYFYGVEPRSNWGVSEPWAAPIPTGRWVAYVQRVKLNTPGKSDGELTYWLVADGPTRGGKPVLALRNIGWRTLDQPQSAINEVWANIYCGGTKCGPPPTPRAHASLRRLTVTDALPDLAAIQAELDRMNRAAG